MKVRSLGSAAAAEVAHRPAQLAAQMVAHVQPAHVPLRASCHTNGSQDLTNRQSACHQRCSRGCAACAASSGGLGADVRRGTTTGHDRGGTSQRPSCTAHHLDELGCYGSSTAAGQSCPIEAGFAIALQHRNARAVDQRCSGILSRSSALNVECKRCSRAVQCLQPDWGSWLDLQSLEQATRCGFASRER
jgi:hypothetical protein